MKRVHVISMLAIALMACQASGKTEHRKPDVIFVPTPEPVVHGMLKLAEVGPEDVVYDLGCGDGRIAITAARDFGARAVCVDIDPDRVREARKNAEKAGVGDRVEVRHGDMFKTDTSEATVVTLYLLTKLNERLRPKLRKELGPGSRIVSQTFDMGDWKPDETRKIDDKKVFLWKISKDDKQGQASARKAGKAGAPAMRQ